MKRKILSLALALMMIVSVAAALPVSADDVEPININMSDTAQAPKGGSATVYSFASAATSVPEDATWVTAGGKRFFQKGLSIVTTTINVETAGYYDVSLAYGSPVTANVHFRVGSAYIKESLAVTGTRTTLADYKATSGIVNVKKFTDKVYLTAGDNPIYLQIASIENVTAADNGDAISNQTPFYAYNILLEYSGNQTTYTDIIVPADYNDEGMVGGGQNLTTAPADDFGWVPSKLGYAMTTPSAHDGTYTVVIPADGWYEISTAGSKWSSYTTLKGNIVIDGTNTVASAVGFNAGSTAVSNVVVKTTDRFELTEGIHTIKLDYTSGFGNIHGFKVFRSADQSYPAAQYTITATKTGNGTVAIKGNATNEVTVEEGNEVTLTATPDFRYEFKGWYLNGSLANSNPTFTFAAEATNTYEARFAAIPGTIIDASDMRKITSSGYYTGAEATTNNTNWASSTGIIYLNAQSGCTIAGTATITEDGWYDVSIAYGGERNDIYALVSFDTATAGSVDLQSAVPSTGNFATCNASSLGTIYLKAGESNVNLTMFANTTARAFHIYGIKIAPAQQESTSVLINCGLPTSHSSSATYNDKVDALFSHLSGVSWATKGSTRFWGVTCVAEYTAYVPTSGYYVVKTAAYAGENAIMNLSVDNSLVASSQLNVCDDPGTNLNTTVESTIAKIYIPAGIRTFKVTSGSNGYRLYNIKLDFAGEVETGVVSVTNEKGVDLDAVTAGGKAYAEIVLTGDITGNLFLVQYAGSGDTKTMVKNSYTAANAEFAYEMGGYKFYRASLTTNAVAGSVKAFYWATDDSFAPLSATDSASVVNN